MCTLIEIDEFGDKPKKKLYTTVEPQFDYDFYTDEVIEKHALRDMCSLVPQEGLKYSIINIITYICSAAVVDYMSRYCKLANSPREGVPCKMVMKNEFLIKRLMLTANRRNYADILLLQEGCRIPNNINANLVLAGLQIGKSSLSKGTKDKLKKILYEDILNTDRVDQIKVMKKLVFIEKEITRSILNKETTYYKPDNVAPMHTYSEPMRQNGVRAIWLYNELREGDMPAMNPEERNQIIKIKLNINKNNIGQIQDTHPEVYNKLVKLMADPTTCDKLGTIGLPIDSAIPDWVLNFVNITEIVNDNLQNFPLESIGLRRLNNDAVNYSNIISL